MTRASDASPLFAVCALARAVLNAGAVSIATVHDDGLRYVAADGVSSDQIIGTLLPPGAGIAGFVAATGQSVTVRDPVSDPRFSREVGERTGYVPDTIQCVAVLDSDGDVGAVLSVLDRGSTQGADEAGSGSGVIGLVVEIAASLIGEPVVPGGFDGRLAALDPRDRSRAVDVVTAVLDAFES